MAGARVSEPGGSLTRRAVPTDPSGRHAGGDPKRRIVTPGQGNWP